MQQFAHSYAKWPHSFPITRLAAPFLCSEETFINKRTAKLTCPSQHIVNFILNVTIYYHNNWSCETKFVLIIHPRVVSFLRYRSKKIVIKYFNYYQLVTFNIIKVLVNIIWKTNFLSINLGLNKTSSETGVLKSRHRLDFVRI